MKKILLILSSFIFLTSIVTFAAPRKNNLRNKILLNAVNSNIVGQKVLRITNRFRVNQGLSRLKWDQNLFKIAREHAQKMADKKAPFSHDGFANRASSAASFGKKPKLFGENLFYGNFPNNIERNAVIAWKKSPGHRANLLRNFNACAIGVARNSNGVWYMTQLFALY